MEGSSISQGTTDVCRPATVARAAERAALEAFSAAFTRELHNVGRNPRILWQQLYNRLQWEGEEVAARLAAQLGPRRRPGAGLWFHARTPLGESATLIRALTAASGEISSFAIAPDGSFIAVCQLRDDYAQRSSLGPTVEDYTLHIYDTATGRSTRTIEGVHAVRATAGGVRYGEGAEQWRDLVTGDPVLPGLPVPGHSITVAVRKYGKSLGVRDTATGKSLRSVRVSDSLIEDCAVSPDGSYFVTAAGRTLKVWDTETWELRASLRAAGVRASSCAISPDGRLLAAGGDDKVRVFDAGDFRELLRLDGTAPCAFSPDGRLLAAASADFVVRVWDAQSGEEVATFEGHSNRVTGLAFAPDGSFLGSSSADGTLRLWNVGAGPARVGAPCLEVDLAGVPAAQSFASLGARRGRGGPRLRGVEVDKELGLAAFCGGVLGGASVDGSVYLTGGWSEASGRWPIAVWDRVTGEERFRLSQPSPATLTGWPCGFSVGPEGLNVATFGGIAARMAVLWDAASGQPVRAFSQHESRIVYAAATPNGAEVVTASEDGEVAVWNAESGRERARFTPCATRRRSGLLGAPFWLSPDGGRLAAADDCPPFTASPVAIHLWDLYGRRGPVLHGHRGSVNACAFSADGALLFSAGDDRTVRVWDLRGKGGLRKTLVLPRTPHSLTAHPWAPLLACGAGHPHMFVLELPTAVIGPLPVTPVDEGDGPRVRCPQCRRRFALDRGAPGAVVSCPHADCGRALRVGRPMLVWGRLNGAEALRPRAADCAEVRARARGACARAAALLEQHGGVSWETLGEAMWSVQSAEEIEGVRLLGDGDLLHLTACPACGEDPAAWLGLRPRGGGAKGAAGKARLAGRRPAAKKPAAKQPAAAPSRPPAGSEKREAPESGGFFGRLFGRKSRG